MGDDAAAASAGAVDDDDDDDDDESSKTRRKKVNLGGGKGGGKASPGEVAKAESDSKGQPSTTGSFSVVVVWSTGLVSSSWGEP